MAIADYVTAILGTLGDVNPVDHGGGFVYSRKDRETDEQANPTPELEYIEPPCGDRWDCPVRECHGGEIDDCDDPDCEHENALCVACHGTGERLDLRWTVYRVLVEPYEWADWPAIASYTGLPPVDYVDAFKLHDGAPVDPMMMAHAIEDAASFHGWHEFDSDPLKLTRAEVEARVASLESKVSP